MLAFCMRNIIFYEENLTSLALDINFAANQYQIIPMAIKYEIQKLKNAQGKGDERRFVRIYEQEPMTADELLTQIQDNCSTGATIQRTIMCRKAVTVPTLILQEPVSRSSRRW